MQTGEKLRMTRQRRVILEELKAVSSHPCAAEVYEKVRRRLPRISLGTVYRNLELLSDAGMIQRLDIESGRRRYDGRTGSHYHLRCMRCGRVEDVPLEPVADIESAVGQLSGYEISGHHLEFFGLCPDCRAKIAGGRSAGD